MSREELWEKLSLYQSTLRESNSLLLYWVQ